MRRSTSFAVVAAAAAVALSAAGVTEVRSATWPERIGTAEVRPGERTRGTIPLLEADDGSPIQAPVIVFAGRQRGPVAWLVAGAHGDEFGGALALQRLAQEIKPDALKGLVILIPVANPPAFQAMRRVNPALDDLMDFGDAFPGRPRFATERIAAVYTALWKEHADFVIDCHTGGERFVQQPFVIYTVTGAVPAGRMDALARMFGVPVLWRDREQVFKSDITINLPAMGIPAFLLEVGGGSAMSRQQDDRQAEFALNFLKGAGIVPGQAGRTVDPEIVEGYRIVTPSRGGFFYALAKPGDHVKEGTPLGRVVGLVGEELEVVRSPIDSAVVLGIQDYPVVASGSWTVELGVLANPGPGARGNR